MPADIDWKIMGNIKFHQKLVSLFGIDRFINLPIDKIEDYIQGENEPFPFLAGLTGTYNVVPTDFESQRFLVKNKKSFAGHRVCPIMDEPMLDYLDNKSNLLGIAEDCEVLSPREYTFDQLKKLLPDHRLVVKPNLSSGSKGVFISENRDGAIRYYESLSLEQRCSHIIQDYIVGKDLFYYGIVHHGQIRVSGIIKPAKFVHFGTHFVLNGEIEKNAEKITRHYNYDGPISIDYRIAKDSNKIYLIEINPRNGANAYLFTYAKTNWLFELINLTENFPGKQKIQKIVTSKWKAVLGIAWSYVFFKLMLYRLAFRPISTSTRA